MKSLAPARVSDGAAAPRYYLRIIVRRRAWLIAGLLIPILLSLVLPSLQSRHYVAQAQVEVQPAQESFSLAGPTGAISAGLGPQEVETVVQILTTPAVTSGASRLLHLPASQLPPVTAGVRGGTDVIDISATSPSARGAARLANAYARSLVQVTQGEERDTVTAAIKGELNGFTGQLQSLLHGSASISDKDVDAIDTQIAIDNSDLQEIQSNPGSLSGGVSVVAPAVAPRRPASERGVDLGFGVLAGLLLGIALVGLRHLTDSSLRTADDIEALDLGIPLFGLIASNSGEGGFSADNGSREESLARSMAAYERIRYATEAALGDFSEKVIGISSPRGSEGRTTVATHLARSIAESGRRVILVHADLRRSEPEVDRGATRVDRLGLVDVLSEAIELDQALEATDLPSMLILPVGSQANSTSDVITPNRVQPLINQLRQRADYVIVDLPPVLAIADSLVLGKETDHVVLICRAGRTRAKALRASVRALSEGGVNVFGIVMNDVSSKSYADSESHLDPGFLTATPRPIWWTRPIPLLVLAAVPSAFTAFYLSAQTFWSEWKVPKYFSASDLLWCLWVVCLFVIAIYVGKGFVRGRRSAAPLLLSESLAEKPLNRLFTILYRVTMIGYIIWFGVAIHRGVRLQNIINLLSRSGSSVYQLKSQLESVSGVTTIVEVGIAAAIVGSYALFVQRDQSVRRRLVFLVLIVAVRALLDSERLALIEIVVPMIVVWAAAKVSSGALTRRRRMWLALIPVIAPLVLVLYFGGTEYFRSYTYYSQHEQTNLWQFSAERIEGYYTTSYNNGAILERYFLPGKRIPYFTIEAFWKAPGVAQLLPYSKFAGIDAIAEEKILYQQYGNPEFNNPGGLLVPKVDYGALWGSVFILGSGLAIGLIYGSWRYFRPLGLLFYPFIVIGILELPRNFYWTAGRTFPAIVALLLSVYALRDRVVVGISEERSLQAPPDLTRDAVSVVSPLGEN